MTALCSQDQSRCLHHPTLTDSHRGLISLWLTRTRRLQIARVRRSSLFTQVRNRAHSLSWTDVSQKGDGSRRRTQEVSQGARCKGGSQGDLRESPGSLPPSFWASLPTLLTNPGGAWHRAGTQQPPCLVLGTHSTVRVNLGALHGDGDAVEENDDEDHVVKHLVCDDSVTQEAEPAPGQRPKLSGRQAGQQ